MSAKQLRIDAAYEKVQEIRKKKRAAEMLTTLNGHKHSTQRGGKRVRHAAADRDDSVCNSARSTHVPKTKLNVEAALVMLTGMAGLLHNGKPPLSGKRRPVSGPCIIFARLLRTGLSLKD